MTTDKESKLKLLNKSIKKGTVTLAVWLEEIGISRNLQGYYLKSGWLQSLGRGAYIIPHDKVRWEGGLSALQYQEKANIHVGALTALTLQGLSHYFRFKHETIYLFTPQREKLAKWFKDYHWEDTIAHQQTSFLPTDIGIMEHKINDITIKISSPERAIFECLYLVPDKLDMVECYHMMEGLVNLKPFLVQDLLHQCKSIKVKRLFIYMSKKSNQQWLKFIDLSTVDLGTGDRQISIGGTYVSDFKIIISTELAAL